MICWLTVGILRDLYSLPAPVSAFLENGWELQNVEDGAYVAGRDLEFVDMMKNNQSVHFSVYNFYPGCNCHRELFCTGA